MSEAEHKKTPTFYEIAAKIAAFCDEMDKKQAIQNGEVTEVASVK